MTTPREVAAGRQKSCELQVLVELTRRKDNEIQRVFTAERGKLGLGVSTIPDRDTKTLPPNCNPIWTLGYYLSDNVELGGNGHLA